MNATGQVVISAFYSISARQEKLIFDDFCIFIRNRLSLPTLCPFLQLLQSPPVLWDGEETSVITIVGKVARRVHFHAHGHLDVFWWWKNAYDFEDFAGSTWAGRAWSFCRKTVRVVYAGWLMLWFCVIWWLPLSTEHHTAIWWTIHGGYGRESWDIW